MSGEPLIARDVTASGWFGKLPAFGDFVRKGLDDTFVGQLDTWIQSGMLALRSRLAEAWTDAFLEMPVWRFAMAPGSDESTGRIGVLAPSMDRVGRHYPFVLIDELETGVYLEATCARGEWPWHRLEEQARMLIACEPEASRLVVAEPSDARGREVEPAVCFGGTDSAATAALAELLSGRTNEVSLTGDFERVLAAAARRLLLAEPGACVWWWIDTEGGTHVVRAEQAMSDALFMRLVLGRWAPT